MRPAADGVVRILAGMAFVAVLFARPAGQTPGPRDAIVLRSVPISSAPRGLAFANGHLWSIDRKSNVLLQIDPANGNVTSTRRIDAPVTRGLSWDGGAFWCIGAGGGALYQVDATSGRRLKHFGSFPESPADWRALAWDGKYLWVAFEQQTKAGAGLYRKDVSSGQNVAVLAAQGPPLALASDGKRLFMATYDDGGKSAVLVRWMLPDGDAKDTASYHTMERTFTIVARLPGTKPAGLAWDGDALWYADREQARLMRLQMPTE